MTLKFKILAIVLILAEISFQTQYEFVCGQPESVAKKNTKIYDTEYEKAEEMYICLHFAPYGMVIPFRTSVDDFGLIEVKDSYKMMIAKKPASSPLEAQIFVQGQYEDRYSDAQPYLTVDAKKNQRIVNVMHLVIHLEGGKIKKFEWVTGCDGCQKSKTADICQKSKVKFWDFITKKEKNLEQSYCSRKQASCKDKPQECDLKIFVSWKGTDANLHYMVSYANRLTNFKDFNILSYYESMDKYASDRTVQGGEANIVDSGVKTDCFDRPGNCLKTKA